jgi:hypothetical protein
VNGLQGADAHLQEHSLFAGRPADPGSSQTPIYPLERTYVSNCHVTPFCFFLQAKHEKTLINHKFDVPILKVDR